MRENSISAQEAASAFSLLEVLLAIALLASVLVYLLGGFLAMVSLKDETERRIQALQVGERAVGLAQSLPPEAFEEGMKPADDWWREVSDPAYDPRQDAEVAYFDARGQYLGRGPEAISDDQARSALFQAIFITAEGSPFLPLEDSDLLKPFWVRIGWPAFVYGWAGWNPVAPTRQRSLMLTASWRR